MRRILAFIITACVLATTIQECTAPTRAEEPIYIEGALIYDTMDYEAIEKAVNMALGIEEPEVKVKSEIVEEEPEVVDEPEIVEEPEMSYLYSACVTGYCPYCAHCCGHVTGITASGQPAIPWGSVASNSLPFGTEIYIEGLGYFVVNDTGDMGGNTIDVCVNSHEEAYAITGTYDIYIVN